MGHNLHSLIGVRYLLVLLSSLLGQLRADFQCDWKHILDQLPSQLRVALHFPVQQPQCFCCVHCHHCGHVVDYLRDDGSINQIRIEHGRSYLDENWFLALLRLVDHSHYSELHICFRGFQKAERANAG